MKITFEGASRQVGRSQFEVDTGELSLLLDSGVARSEENLPQPPSRQPDAIILSHAHLDHSGHLPAFYRGAKMPWLTTFPTPPILGILWPDSIKVVKSRKEQPVITEKDVKAAAKHCVTLPLGEAYSFFDGTTATLYDAGHVLGSAQTLIESHNKTLLYTGDFNCEQTRNHRPAKPPRKGVDALVIESTYSNRDHAPRGEVEETFIASVKAAIEDGNALVPCFAFGRTQEILQVLESHGIKSDIWVDGMGQNITLAYQDYPSYVNDAKALARAVEPAQFVENHAQRKKLAEGRGNVILTTAGMLEGGPVLSYIEKMNASQRGSILLTGYQVEKTNGRRLVEEKMIKYNEKTLSIGLPVEQYDFSAHTGKTKSFDYIRKVAPQKVFCVHGDPSVCEAFAENLRLEGFDAHAPTIGDEFDV